MLDRRLAIGGAYDCPEEREAVRRFVDARHVVRCECGAEPDPRSFAGECADCQATACKELKPYPEIDPIEEWSAGATQGWEWP